MLFKIQHELIDIDRQQYLTQHDSGPEVKTAPTKKDQRHTYGQSFFPKTIRDWNQLPAHTTSADSRKTQSCPKVKPWKKLNNNSVYIILIVNWRLF
jgi:hypothetical protein